MRFARYALLALAAVACGGQKGGADASVAADAGIDAPSNGERACDYLSGGGCDLGEKCTIRWDSVDPPGGGVDCVPEGDKGRAQACTVDLASGADDCAAGFLCWQVSQGAWTCAEICGTVQGDSCSAGSCMLLLGPSFPDLTEYEGVCVQ